MVAAIKLKALPERNTWLPITRSCTWTRRAVVHVSELHVQFIEGYQRRVPKESMYSESIHYTQRVWLKSICPTPTWHVNDIDTGDVVLWFISETGSAQTAVRAATLRYKSKIKHSISPSHSILSLDQRGPVLTL